MSRRPPRWAEALLSRVLRHPARDEIIGDLGEEFRRNGGGASARLRFVAAAIGVASRVTAARATEGIGRDLKLSFRQLRRDPGFAVVAVTALALGIGVNGVIFAVADEVLLAPLPYPNEERLAIVTNEHTGSTTGGFGVSWLNMQRVAASSRTLQEQSLYMDWQDLTLSGPDGAIRVPTAFVDDAYSELMGLEMAHGRWFGADENGANAADPVAVLSRGAWERIYGADTEVIGRVVRLNGRPYEIIGVLADDRGDLRYRWGEQPVSIFLPLFAAEQLTEFDLDVDRGLRALNALVLLREGTSLQQARRDFNRLSTELTREHPADNEGWNYHLQSLDEAFFEDLQGPTRILLAGSVLVLTLVAVNLITLVLIRAAGRRTEMAMRRALGARATRLTRQLVTESMVLAMLAGGAGVLLASWGVDLIAASRMLDLPSFASLRLDGWIIAAALVGSTVAGIVLGISAVIGARGGSASSSSWRGTDGRTGHRARGALVAAEVALAFTLLVGAGLVLTSFWELRSTGYGFDTDDLLLARVDMRGEAYTPERLRAIADQLAAEGAALPGVREAFIWSPNRLGHGNQVEIVTRENRFAEHPDERLEASLHAVHPGTLAKLGIPLLAGRDVGAADHPDAPRVALISERLAQDLWPGENPIGKRFETREDDEPLFVEVIGVTADARHRTRLIDPFGPQRDVYYAFEQAPWRTVTLALRTETDVAVAPLAAAVRDLVRAIDADLPVYEIATMQQNLRREESSARLSAGLVLVYAVLAVALAALGLYGMLAHWVRARRREIGVRMALGADRRTVLAGTLRSGLAPVAVGGLFGLVASLAAGRILVRALYGVSPHEPMTWLTVPLILALVAVTALYLPARRASCTDPVEVLRTD